MALLRHLFATDDAGIEEISAWLQDAYAAPREAQLDVAHRTFELPLQLTYRGDGGPAQRHLRRTWLYDEYELPLLAGRLLVHGASAARARDRPEPLATLAGLGHYPAIGAMRLDYGDGGWLEIAVDAAFVELEVSDRATELMHRRVGRWIPYESTFAPLPARGPD